MLQIDVEDNERDTYTNTKIKCLEDYIKYDENNIEAYELLGTLYESKKEYIKAINLFKYATEKNPKEYILWYRSGLAYEDIGESAQAISYGASFGMLGGMLIGMNIKKKA